MTPLTAVILYTSLAGLCIPLGGLLASFGRLRPRWLDQELRHFIIALGGGVLLGAVALTLVPEGMASLQPGWLALLVFLAGGLVFFGVERMLGLQRREKPQLTGMLLDYIPEALALGGMAATGAAAAPLLALLIGIQNVPEGFNAFRELAKESRRSRRRTLWFMLALVPVGPALGALGYWFLDESPALLGGTMLFASGGILYLVFQDIAPQSRLQKHWAPPLGAVLGFGLALFGQLLIGTGD